MDLTNSTAVREFLALCLDPGHGIKRTPATLANVMPGPLRAAVDQFAPHLAALRQAADEADRQARAAGKAYSDAFAVWITTGEEPATDPGQCPQNRVGNFIQLTDPAQLGPHFYQESELGLRCVYCDVPAHWGGEPDTEPVPRTYVYVALSPNRTTKHIVDPAAPHFTACPSRFAASNPIPTAEAARLPLCDGCRLALTGKPGEQD